MNGGRVGSLLAVVEVKGPNGLEVSHLLVACTPLYTSLL